MANPRTIARLESRILQRAAYCLQFEIRDPRAAFITVTRVELSSDLRHGKIHWSVLGDESERSRAEHMLEHAAGFIQRQVARVLETRHVPHLRWVYDESIVEAARMDQLIREARERDRAIAEAAAAAADADPSDADPAAAEPAAAADAEPFAAEPAAGGAADGTADEPLADEDGRAEP